MYNRINGKDKILSDAISCVDHLGDSTNIHLKDEIIIREWQPVNPI